MLDFNKAKEIYNSTEIPRELDAVVENSIKRFEEKRKSRIKIHFIRLAPVAACAVICLAVGISVFSQIGQNESFITADNVDAGAPKLARNATVAGARMSENESVAVTEAACGEVVELYSDENVYSYCITTYPSKNVNYYNVKQSNGEEIALRDILKDTMGLEDCQFYFKSANCIVVICDGEDKEIILE